MAATIVLALATVASAAILMRPAADRSRNDGDGLALGLAAGCLGALASVCGKLGLQPGAVALTRGSSFAACLSRDGHSYGCEDRWPALALRAAALAGLAASNAGMLACFVRALRRAGALRATVCSNAGGLAASGALGALVFGEAPSATWVAGALLMAAGVAVLAGDAGDEGKSR